MLFCSCAVFQVLARSSPDDKHLLVTRLNGTSLPRDRSAWEEQHPTLKWAKDKDTTLPGYWDEVCSFEGGADATVKGVAPFILIVCSVSFCATHCLPVYKQAVHDRVADARC